MVLLGVLFVYNIINMYKEQFSGGTKMSKYNVAVLFGGTSSEHDISLLSATSVLNNLNTETYTIYPVGITKQGLWYLYSGDISFIKSGEWQNNNCTPAAFCPGSGKNGLVVFDSDKTSVINIDVVFPVLHGKYGEDGTVQGLLELTGIPYVGSGVLGSAVCMDKIIANCVMDASGIKRCEWSYMLAHEFSDFDNIEKRVSKKLGYPIFVKPANAGSSVGVSKAANKQELFNAVKNAFEHDDRILFERFVNGQEVECAVRGNEIVTSTLPGEILASKDFYDFEDKYVTGESKTQIPANLSDEKLKEVQREAIKAYRALCCKGFSRVDFFVEKNTGNVLLNEINTLPGFTNISMYPKLMIEQGETYNELLDSLINLALDKT